MLKTSSTKSTDPRKSVVEVSGNSRARRSKVELDKNRKNNVEVDGGEVEDEEVGKKG